MKINEITQVNLQALKESLEQSNSTGVSTDNLMAIAEEVTKVHAICVETGNPAGYSFRKSDSNNLVLIGEKKEYSPLSREVFFKKMAKRKEQ